jgi:hypothetical protein
MDDNARLLAIAVLLAEPEAINDILETELYILREKLQAQPSGVRGLPERGGGAWLLTTCVPSGLRASMVPSGCRVISQPQRWTQVSWWNSHYAELRVMPF